MAVSIDYVRRMFYVAGNLVMNEMSSWSSPRFVAVQGEG